MKYGTHLGFYFIRVGTIFGIQTLYEPMETNFPVKYTVPATLSVVVFLYNDSLSLKVNDWLSIRELLLFW